MNLHWKAAYERIGPIMLQNVILWTFITAFYVMLVPVKNIPAHILTVSCLFSVILLIMYFLTLFIISYRINKHGGP